MTQLQAIDGKLKSLAASSIEGMERLVQLSQKVQDHIAQEFSTHERRIIHSVIETMTFEYGEEGATEQEYKLFITKLPQDFQDKFNNIDKTWAEIAGPDGILSLEEFQNLCDTFAEQRANEKLKERRK